ncbi:MAG: flagellar biosynthesis protein FlhB [Paracoccaceae bacterium]
MAEPETGQEKSHDATPRRLEKAREQGDLPRSQDAQTLAGYLGFAGAVLIGGAFALETLGATLRTAVARPDAVAAAIFAGGAADTLGRLAAQVLGASVALFAAPAALILALLIASRGIVFASDKISPKLSRISPVANAGQKFGPTGLVEFAKSAAKLTAILIVLGIVLAIELPRLARYALIEPRFLGTLLSTQFWALMAGVLVASVAIAALDVAWQRADFLRRNRMTHQELKEETKQTEGDPQLKAERRERARQMSQTQMLFDVPKADVVVVNPTHYAVALAWDRTRETAPRCLAKGVDEIAHRIREIAERHEIPQHRDPATARSLHALVSVGEEIKPEHYQAVAAAILFAQEMRQKARVRLW